MFCENIKNISFYDIDPFVRFVDLIHLNPSVPAIEKTTYDHRILYAQDGKGTIHIDGIVYPLRKGDLFFWGPLTRYSVERDKEHPATIINIAFDFTQNFKGKTQIPYFIAIQGFTQELFTERILFKNCKIFNSHFRVEHYPHSELLLSMVNEHRLQKLYFVQETNSIFHSILVNLARSTSMEKGNSKGQLCTADLIIEYIHNHCMEPLTNMKIGKVFNFHPNYINRLIVSSTGISLHQYVLNVKIRKALVLLQSSNLSIKEVSEKLNFADISHFSKAFKRILGFNPSKILT